MGLVGIDYNYREIMKQLLSFALVWLFSLTSLAETKVCAAFCLESQVVQQTSNWEYLGKVNAHYYIIGGWLHDEFDLYVKVISGKSFYQVRKEGKSYSVSVGKYSHQGKTFNASFSMGNNGTYYFNL